jgi:predicted TIM-barrel fold metal-dependent hydrolase
MAIKISADSHLDLGWLPADTFTSRVPKPFRDRVPRVVESEDGPFWEVEGTRLSGVAGVGSRGRPYSPGRWARADRMAETGLYDDPSLRPGNPLERWRDQERDGIDAEVIYGLFGIGPSIQDPDLRSLVYRTFNDFLIEFCAHMPDRYLGLACLPIEGPDAAATELHRAADAGLRGAVMDILSAALPIHDRSWDPVWSAAQERDMPVSFHLGSGRPSSSITKATVLGSMQPLSGGLLAEAATKMAALPLGVGGAADYFGIVMGGALDRFPNLKIVLGESGIGWIPMLLERMDWVYENEFRALDLELRPSEYWHRQMFATFQKDAAGIKLIDALGPGHVMFASDYPHPDGIFPDSRSIAAVDFAGLSVADRDMIEGENAAALYQMPRPKLATPAQPAGVVPYAGSARRGSKPARAGL